MPFHLFGKKPTEAKRSFCVVAYGCECHIVRLIQVNIERQGATLTVAETPDAVLRLCENGKTNLLVLDSDDPDTAALKKQVEGNPATAHIKVMDFASHAMVYPRDPPGPSAPATAPATLGELLNWKR